MTRPKFNLYDKDGRPTIVEHCITVGHGSPRLYNRPMRWQIIGICDAKCGVAEHEFLYRCRGVFENGNATKGVVDFYEPELVISRPFAEDPREPEAMWGGPLVVADTQSTAAALTSAWANASPEDVQRLIHVHRFEIEAELAGLDGKPEDAGRKADADVSKGCGFSDLESAWQAASLAEVKALVARYQDSLAVYLGELP